MNLNEGKELALKMWTYLAEHPKIKMEEKLPPEIFDEIKLCINDDPMCSLFFEPIDQCMECPLYPCTESDDHYDNDDEALYSKWNFAVTDEERKNAALKIVKKIEAFDPSKPPEAKPEREKIERWDFVDNEIHEMMKRLNPSKEKLKWDIKPISEIREVLVRYFVEELKLCTEEEFYP